MKRLLIGFGITLCAFVTGCCGSRHAEKDFLKETEAYLDWYDEEANDAERSYSRQFIDARFETHLRRHLRQIQDHW